MNKVEKKLIGTTLTTSAVFKNDANVVVYPATVNLKYKKPNNQIVTVAVTPVSNKFSSDVLLDSAGIWYFRWESVGANSIAEEFTVQVLASSVV